MSYTWTNGEIITAEKLNSINNNVISGKEVMIITFTDDGNENYTADKTYQEIAEYIENGGYVVGKRQFSSNGPWIWYQLTSYINNSILFINFSPYLSGTDTEIVGVSVEFFDIRNNEISYTSIIKRFT